MRVGVSLIVLTLCGILGLTSGTYAMPASLKQSAVEATAQVYTCNSQGSAAYLGETEEGDALWILAAHLLCPSHLDHITINGVQGKVLKTGVEGNWLNVCEDWAIVSTPGYSPSIDTPVQQNEIIVGEGVIFVNHGYDHPSIAKAYITSVSPGSFTTTLRAAPGTSGAGVYNFKGELLGIVTYSSICSTEDCCSGKSRFTIVTRLP